MEEDFQRIKTLLDAHNIKYELLVHEAVFTSEQAANARKAKLEEGAKSMIVRSEGKFYNFVLSAALKIDWAKVRFLLQSKSVSLATKEEVLTTIHCEIGSVPPFGNLYGLEVYCDKSLLQHEMMEFNAGLHTHSIRMKVKDWQQLVQPKVVHFTP